MKKAIVLILIIAVALLASCSKSDSKAEAQTAAQSQASTVQFTVDTQAMNVQSQASTAQSAAQEQAATAQTTAQTQAATAQSEQAAVTAPQELKPATIKVWYSISGTNGQFFESQVQAFMAKYPNIKVELTYTGSYADSATKISAAKLAGNSPDIAITSASQLYTGEDGNFSMETDVLDPDFNVDDIRPGILEYANYRGQLAAVPFSISTQVIYYNKDLAAKAGYDLEANPPRTWEEFLEVAKAIQSASSKGTYGFDTSDAKWLVKNMLYQNGNEIVRMDADGNVTPVFADESGIEVARFWARLVDEKVMAKSQHDNAENKFLSGKLVFIAATSNRIAKWAESVQFNIGAIEMPYFKEQKVALGGSTATIMTTDPVRHAASWALLKFLLNTENQTAYALTTGYLPIRESSLDIPQVQAYMQESDLYATAIKQLDYSTAYVHFGEMGSMDTQLTWALDDIENGTDPKRAFQDAQEQLLEDLK
jgi:sn-glycerol 3-phosphate transport system substrate-binding protein